MGKSQRQFKYRRLQEMAGNYSVLLFKIPQITTEEVVQKIPLCETC